MPQFFSHSISQYEAVQFYHKPVVNG
jgi:hypothetical protein